MSTTAELNENSHRGFEGLKATLCLALMDAKSNNASEMPVCLRPNGIGSRCSGKERDETGLDYFGARYFSGAQARFITPDWSETPTPVPYADYGDPQTLNLYAYVRNNPLLTADLDGHGTWYSPSGKKIGTDGVNDGAVHVAKKENVTIANKRIDPSNTTDMLVIPGKAGNQIHEAIDRTRESSFDTNPPDRMGNNHEEAFTMNDKSEIRVSPPGPAITPNSSQVTVPHDLYSDTVLAIHTHAGAMPDPNTLGGRTYDQNPSKGPKGDLGKAARHPKVIHGVAGSMDEKVRFYDGKGTYATIKLNAFPKCKKNGDNCF